MNDQKIIQIAVVVKDLQEALPRYARIIHPGPWDIYEFAPPEMQDLTYRGKPSEWSARIALAWVGDRHFEIIQPLKGPNVYYDHMEKKGEGLHHIKEWAPDCQAKLEEYAKKGLQVIQSGRLGKDEFYYLDTFDALGFYYEIGNNGDIRKPDDQWTLHV
jgi:hypothetical protein